MSGRLGPIVARVDVVVARPVAEVFSTFVDLRTEPNYNPDVRDVQKATPGPIGRGTEFVGHHRGMGAVTWRLSEFEQDRHVAIEGAVGKGTYRWLGDFEPTAGGTRLKGAIEWRPARGWGVFRPVLALLLRARAVTSFRRFAREVGSPPRVRLDALLLALFVVTVVLLVVDLVADWHGSPHVAIEIAATLVALFGVVVLWSRYRTERRDHLHARQQVHSSRAEAERWRESARAAVEGLASAIDVQFDAWVLTPAERELGFLLLKGLSLKDAAAVLGKSERTVRQQSLGIYRKGGLAGRAELSAFFLEDLLTRRT